MIPASSAKTTDMSANDFAIYNTRLKDPKMTDGAAFLGDNETFQDVAQKDLQICRVINITPQQIADKLNGIIFKYDSLCATRNPHSDLKRRDLFPVALIEDIFEVSIHSYMGDQCCPFGGRQCGTGKQDFTVRNIATNETFCFGTLLPHLIETHEFFEGATAYRVDPLKARDFFKMQPHVDYRCERVLHETRWELESMTSRIYADKKINKARERAQKIVNAHPDIEGLIIDSENGKDLHFYTKGLKEFIYLDDTILVEGSKVSANFVSGYTVFKLTANYLAKLAPTDRLL